MRSTKYSGWCTAFCLTLVLAANACAQDKPHKPSDLTLDRDYVRRVITAAIKAIADNFAFPEERDQLVRTLTAKLNSGGYDGITSALKLVPQVNQDLQAGAHDAHLRFGYSFEPQAMNNNVDEDLPAEIEKERAASSIYGFGLHTVERLPGDIGYLRLDNFERPEVAAEQIGMAFKMLATTRALIVDLRENRGGDIYAVPMFVSYFLPPTPVLLGEAYSSIDNRNRQQWSLAYVPGPRYRDRPVYVLTSANTFSAAEGVTSLLKRFGATLVGERTRGGAHPNRWFNIDPHFAISVPVLRPLGPDWEGTGIAPDVAVPAGSALEEATKLASAKIEAHH